MNDPEASIILLSREELTLLHNLLVIYESPYTLPSEHHERTSDNERHEQLRRPLEEELG